MDLTGHKTEFNDLLGLILRTEPNDLPTRYLDPKGNKTEFDDLSGPIKRWNLIIF